MKLSIEHTCFSQHLNENKPKRCSCRKRITQAEATRLVERGFADWIILSYTDTVIKEICHICFNSDLKKSCQECKSLGEIEKSIKIKNYGTDIVLVTIGSPDERGNLLYKPVLAKKTPRVATIEPAHIERAYIEGIKEEQERIEEYGLMTLLSRIEMKIGTEPLDDPKIGTGRTYDRGRSPFARIADERTSIGSIGSRITAGFILSSSCESERNINIVKEEKDRWVEDFIENRVSEDSYKALYGDEDGPETGYAEDINNTED